jgi:Uma2 family endonuclease
MTAEPVSWAARSGLLSVGDLLRGAEGMRCELIDGSLTVTPLGDAEHQDLVGRYYTALVASIPAELRALPGVNVIDGSYTVLQPDVVVIDPALLTDDGLGVTPEGLRLVVEITSPSTWRRDLTIKRSLYAAWGVPYLVVDRRSDPHKLEVFGDLPDYAAGLVKAPPQ